MDSFRRGFGFLKQAWQMAFADKDLIKPSIISLVVGFVVTVFGILPIIAAGALMGDSIPGRVIIFLLGLVLVFVQYVVSYVFSAMTVYLIYGYLAEGDGRMDKAWAIVKREFFHIVTLAAASTAVSLLKSAVRGKRGGLLRDALAGLIETVWTEASYLVLPAMVIEDIGLQEGLKRVTHIVRENLLLVAVSTVGVRAVTGLIGFLLGATGIGLGFGAGLGLVTITQQSTFGWITGVGLGVLIAGAFILVATVISSYTATAYHTCLYLWARSVEQAQQQGVAGQSISAPAPLAAVL